MLYALVNANHAAQRDSSADLASSPMYQPGKNADAGEVLMMALHAPRSQCFSLRFTSSCDAHRTENHIWEQISILSLDWQTYMPETHTLQLLLDRAMLFCFRNSCHVNRTSISSVQPGNLVYIRFEHAVDSPSVVPCTTRLSPDSLLKHVTLPLSTDGRQRSSPYRVAAVFHYLRNTNEDVQHFSAEIRIGSEAVNGIYYYDDLRNGKAELVGELLSFQLPTKRHRLSFIDRIKRSDPDHFEYDHLPSLRTICGILLEPVPAAAAPASAATTVNGGSSASSSTASSVSSQASPSVAAAAKPSSALSAAASAASSSSSSSSTSSSSSSRADRARKATKTMMKNKDGMCYLR